MWKLGLWFPKLHKKIYTVILIYCCNSSQVTCTCNNMFHIILHTMIHSLHLWFTNKHLNLSTYCVFFLSFRTGSMDTTFARQSLTSMYFRKRLVNTSWSCSGGGEWETFLKMNNLNMLTTNPGLDNISS